MASDFREFLRSQRDDYEAAIADFTEAIRIDPQYGPAYRHRGDAHYENGEYEEAISDYTEVIRMYPQADVAHFSRGVAYFDKGNYYESPDGLHLGLGSVLGASGPLDLLRSRWQLPRYGLWIYGLETRFFYRSIRYSFVDAIHLERLEEEWRMGRNQETEQARRLGRVGISPTRLYSETMPFQICSPCLHGQAEFDFPLTGC